MADNITLNVGSGGANLAADDVSGVLHQRVKIEFGTDGSATDVSASNPLPVSLASVPSHAVTNAGTFAVQAQATAGASDPGLSMYKRISDGADDREVVKASAGRVHSIVAQCVSADIRYLKLYNRTSLPTLASDAPVQTFAIPANGVPLVVQFPRPLAFATGIAIAITKNPEDDDESTPDLSEVVVNIGYV